ncbi:acyl-CoA dehydratase activase [Anaerotruncus colihominis]|uniref:2-hydroxyglutaryl-CoA dehydratase component A n=2 Tax=Anaerotruncus colihominis TaxID=169435 RepID=A0A174SFP7_9FIRM|nr:acyl-CoA dehydratase activase [Anaerotruncus colihominis]MCQ4734612.1 acyl-CoA dehydratase activase [Anaerotruncus colihominis]CUP93339.1 2-hydroxyglutaryl-CoA dehydratase component A [Anaerotruncus colihominis]
MDRTDCVRPLTIGVDIGSTTVKVIIVKDGEVVYQQYERHMSQVRPKTLELIRMARDVIGGQPVRVALSGSAGLGVAKAAGLPFIQEVFATGEVIKAYAPDTDCVIELGGEDAKIIFFTGGLEERMNGSCAGGTGAFIDQMATLLDVTPAELDTLALGSEKLYTIASRCGVFAKSDIQPLLNQGARKEDIAASIFKAVVDQTITGLAQGRRITGKVLFLGGPLYFFKALQREFVRSLGLSPENAVFPDMGRYAVALGSALYAEKAADPLTYDELVAKIEDTTNETPASRHLRPLFENLDDYAAFSNRHAKASVGRADLDTYEGTAYLGVDCGSTTTKLVLIAEDGRILYDYYSANRGNPVELVRAQLETLLPRCEGRVQIRGGAATGYGEDLVKNAFTLDAGLVETMAHFKAARFFNPDVDFILDIGGQDIKCFKVRNDSIDSIMLNEACSSGCGSFISTFAQSMGYDVEQFAKLGLFARYPVDLGSRCTVFMNSSVKQAQKEGASVEDISAGISMSVVKNAIYKVIRAHSAKELGENIVVQGGTFLNDAVLRSFEMELGHDVVRPQIAGLMGAFGAALYARELELEQSAVITAEALKDFQHESRSAVCGLCGNHCNLTVNTFGGGRKFISGNRCERPLGRAAAGTPANMYAWKLQKLLSLAPVPGPRGKIGLPLGLNMLENLPFWHAFLTKLGFEVVTSGVSTRETYIKGQFSIPSDTVCYPAKLMHGHIADLLERGVKTIFYPCMTYNFDEQKGDNHFNCPVVAYYPELLHANVAELNEPDVHFLYPHVAVHRPKKFAEKIHGALAAVFPDITQREVRAAAGAAYAAYDRWMQDVKAEGRRVIDEARAAGRRIIVLAGRPYHIDPEISHGIDALIASFDIAVVSEDCVADLEEPVRVHVLNQWTYHARLYNAAKYVTRQPDMELVQLVSFGCGIDAITTDEVRAILEDGGKLYTQLKIDEISNLGAVKIRIRSLLEAVEERRRVHA